MEEFKSRRERAKQKIASVKKGEEASKPSSPSKVKQTTPWYMKKKVLFIVAGIVVAALILGGLAFWFLNDSTHKVRAALTQSRQEIQAKTNALSEAEDKKVALTQLSDILDPVSCKVYFMPAMGETGDQCKEHNEAVEVYRGDIEKLQQLFEYDEYMKSALGKVNQEGEVSDYTAEEARLDAIKSAVDEAPHRELIGKPHTAIAESIATIAATWGGLSEVSGEEDEEKYDEALEEITPAYAAFQKNASDLMHVYTALQRTADESYKKATQQ